MHAYTSSLRPNPADADDTYVASGYRTPSRFGFPPPNAGMVITFWVPSFTGSSNWPALRSTADPSSQPIGHFQAHAIRQHQQREVIRKLQNGERLALHVIDRRRVEPLRAAHDDPVDRRQGKPLNLSDLREVHAPCPASRLSPISSAPAAATAIPGPEDTPSPSG